MGTNRDRSTLCISKWYTIFNLQYPSKVALKARSRIDLSSFPCRNLGPIFQDRLLEIVFWKYVTLFRPASGGGGWGGEKFLFKSECFLHAGQVRAAKNIGRTFRFVDISLFRRRIVTWSSFTMKLCGALPRVMRQQILRER